MSEDEIAFATVDELASAYRSGRLSPVEVVGVHLHRIRLIDPVLHSYISVSVEEAKIAAEKAEEELRRGYDRGPLQGVPFAVKDQIATAGIRTSAGSLVLKDWIPRVDAFVVRHMKAAGAVLLGKLNMMEFATGTSQYPFGTPRNPWNVERETGGSSCGSGSAPAIGLATITLGEDTVGSVRVPAAYCGIVGLRPTWGLVSSEGLVPAVRQLDVIGPMGRTVGDVHRALVGLTSSDTVSEAEVSPRLGKFADALWQDRPKAKAGVVKELMTDTVLDTQVRDSVQAAIRVLEDLGVVVEEVSLPLVAYADAVFRAFADAEAALSHLPYLRRWADKYGPAPRVRLAAGLLIPSFMSEWAERIGLAAISKQVMKALADHDVLLSPTMPTAAPRISQTEPQDTHTLENDLEGFRRNAPYVMPFSFAGVPALALPCGFDSEGLPLSLQIIGRPYEDLRVLAIGDAYQLATEWHLRHPAPPAG